MWRRLKSHGCDRGAFIHHRSEIRGTLLLEAACHGACLMLRLLLSQGAHADAVTNTSQTALHLAASNSVDGPAMVEPLVAAGVMPMLSTQLAVQRWWAR